MLRIGTSWYNIIGEPKVLGEYHGTHEILRDLEITFAFK